MHLVLVKGNGDPWIAGKIIEEFGYGGALFRVKSVQDSTNGENNPFKFGIKVGRQSDT